MVQYSRKITCYLILLSGLFLGFTAFGQSPSLPLSSDSAKAIPDTLLFRIQTAQSAITEINAANKKGYDLEAIKNRIENIRMDIKPLQVAFAAKGEQPDSKSLLSYDLILKDADVKLKSIADVLIKNSNDLQRMNEQVLALSNDSLLKINANGNSNKDLYSSQIADLKQRLQNAGKVTGSNLDSVNRLLAENSELNILVNDLRALASDKLSQSGKMALSKQDPYLWEAPLSDKTDQPTAKLLVAAYQGQQQILRYFINSTWDNRFVAIMLALAFMIWVHRNFKSASRASVKRKIGELNFEYIRPYPILSSFIVLFAITPLFEPDAPSLYIELISLFLLICISVHLWKRLDKKQLRFWLLIIFLFACIIAGNAVVNAAWPLRLVMIAINLFFVYLGFSLRQKMTITAFPKRYARVAIWVLIIFNIFSALLNIFGRIDMAKVTLATGVIGIIELIGLAVFTQIVLDAFELQMRISSCNKGIFSRVNHAKAKSKLKKVLSIGCLIVWLMVLMINLSVIGGIWEWIDTILSKPRTFGSIHFSFSNILFFSIIIYVAGKLQKHVPLLFGEEKITFNEASGHKGSKVALVRLVIIVIGVLLAVTASGLPMDKLTVVLGAFGVGIGLGMQNIVNNFVSGIILIFEKPFRIGDYVELADKKGKVRDIGIRSSKLLTPQGSEVIIPNGDLLSGRLVNWTLSNDFIKTEIIFKVAIDADMDVISKLVNDLLSDNGVAVKQLPPEILLNTVTADAIEIKVLAWISSIYVEAEFKSTFFKQLLPKLSEKSIALK